MAITIETAPNNFNCYVQDTMWHVVSSNHSSIPDFKYVFDVYVDGVQKIRVKQYPDPGTTFGYFDAGAIVRNSMEYNWFDTSLIHQDFDINKRFKIDYNVRYGEEYSGTTTLNLASGTTTAFNFRPDLFKRKATQIIGDFTDKFFSERSKIVNVDFNNNFFIPYNSTNAGQYSTYDQNNNLIVSHGYSDYQYEITNMIDIFTEALSYNAKYVKFETRNTGLDVVDTMYFYNKCNPKYETIPIHFVNRFGLWETLHFTLVSRLTMDVERKGFERRDFIIDGADVNYFDANNVYAESKINYSNKMNWSYRLTADSMSDTDYAWASQLITSPQIYMEVDDYFYPVTIKNTNYEYSKYVNNRQRALEVDFEMNQTRYSHLR
jgi:hypothetical protein